MLKSSNDSFHLEDYQSMTKDQLLKNLLQSKINEARAKKGYEVKGDGQNKEFGIFNAGRIRIVMELSNEFPVRFFAD